jgi:hypothetical protein
MAQMEITMVPSKKRWRILWWRQKKMLGFYKESVGTRVSNLENLPKEITLLHGYLLIVTIFNLAIQPRSEKWRSGHFCIHSTFLCRTPQKNSHEALTK